MMRIACDRPWLGVDLGAPHRVLSWAVHRPGLVSAQRILWREVRDADLTPDLDVAPWLAAELASRDESGSVAMLTSRDVRRHHHAVARIGGIEVEALATVGLSNAERVGRRREPDPAGWGTINMAVRIGAALDLPALVEAMTIAAQARTAAMIALGPVLSTGQATGTGTDCIALAARLDGTALPHAGLHTALGEALGRACHDAVAAGVRAWMQAPPPLPGRR
ncbi:adenosylcobinamide amidohydrolase [Paracoccus yeei]|uniref:adenosylcobinamide amidohydrolase n=1 Tax=Paracoccus yeei TaxID=147645 RepID=UPI003BF799D7